MDLDGEPIKKISLISKLLLVIVLLVGSFTTFAPINVLADSVSDNQPTNQPTNPAIKQIVQASTLASAQRATDTSGFTSIVNKTDLNTVSNTSLINALTSPLVIDTKSDSSASGVTDGTPVNNIYLQADVSFLVRSFTKDTKSGAASSTTITVRNSVTNELTTGTIDNFTIYDDAFKNGPNVATPGKTATNAKGDTISVPKDDSKTATLTYNIKSGNTVYQARNGAGAVAVSATIRNQSGQGTNTMDILVRSAYVKASNYNPSVFNDTKIHFWIDDTLRKKIIIDTIAKARGEASLYDPTVTVTWRVVTPEDKDDGANSTKTTVASKDDTINPDELNLNQDAFDFDHIFYTEEPGTSTDQLFVYADVSMNYTDKKGKSQTYHTLVDDFKVTNAIGAEEQEDVPEVSMTNTVNNVTTPENDGTTNDPNDTVNSTMPGNDILFTSNLVDDFNQGSGISEGDIVDGTYKTEIPKNMKISNVDIERANNDTDNPPPINQDSISVEDDPSDTDKSILTIKDIYLPPTIGSGDTNTEYKLTFHGEVPADYNKSISLTPTFDGSGGNDHDGNPLPIDQAVGTENFINFDDTPVEPDGKIELEPMDIEFGTINAMTNSEYVKHRVTPDNGDVLKVSDTRSVKKQAQISIVADNLKTKAGLVFPGTLMFYNAQGSAQVIDNTTPVIISQTEDGESLSDISWGKNEGLLLHINKQKVIPQGNYSTDVCWTATDSL